MSHKLLVTLCTYNERENLPLMVENIRQVIAEAHILVIDDNSPDGTGQLAEELAVKYGNIHVLHRAGKLGLGTATLAGLQFAIDKNYDFVANMDADLSHNPDYLPAMIAALDRVDVAVGSRYVQGGGVEGWGMRRYLMSWCINFYARICLGLKLRDCSGSYRCYRVSKLAEIDFSKFLSHGYAIQEELLYRCRRVGCTFEEVPILFEDRRYGSSKINYKEAITAVWVMTRLAGQRMMSTPVQKEVLQNRARQ
jgi:dolichol-phosphate mannosyltransferase